MSVVDNVIEAINSGKDVVSIIKGLFGKKLSPEERWYIGELLRGYEHEKQTNELRQEYKEGTEKLVGEYRQGTQELKQEYHQGTERLVGEYKEGRQEIRQGFEGLRQEYREGTERLVGEYRQGRQEIREGFAGVREEIRELGNHFSSLEQATRELYSKIEGLVEGIIVGRKE